MRSVSVGGGVQEYCPSEEAPKNITSGVFSAEGGIEEYIRRRRQSGVLSVGAGTQKYILRSIFCQRTPSGVYALEEALRSLESGIEAF